MSVPFPSAAPGAPAGPTTGRPRPSAPTSRVLGFRAGTAIPRRGIDLDRHVRGASTCPS